MVFFGDVFGDVLFGVVGAHLFLVDVFFEDVTEDIGIDFIIVFQRAVVKVPLVALKERKEPFKGGVGNLNRLPVMRLYLVFLEDAAVEVGHVPKQKRTFLLSVRSLVWQILQRRAGKEMRCSIGLPQFAGHARDLFAGSPGRHSGSPSSG